MPVMTVGTGTSLIRGHYHEKVLATQPIAYWPLCEAAGTTARCLTNTAMNGTYNSDVSTWPPGSGIGDGNSAPVFDGTNDLVNIWTATFAAAFDGQEGSVMTWQRVANAGIWTDGINRWIINLRRAATDEAGVYKPGANNRIDWYYTANGVTEAHNNVTTTTDWFQQVMTWSVAADEVRYYQFGAWLATDTVLGAFVGPIANGAVVIGSRFVPVNLPWSGGIAHVAYWNNPLPASTIADLAVV